MIVVIGKKQVYSYSPVTNSFAKNQITIGDNFEIAGVGSYLTYLYLLEKNSNKLYRYSRAPGGFGTPKDWLKEEADLSNATDLDVSEAVYVSYNSNLIQRFFSYKKTNDFYLEDGFVVNKIRTEEGKNKIFAFDKNQGKIVELSEEGETIKIFQDKKFKNAKDISVNFENNQVFVITEDNKIWSFDY